MADRQAAAVFQYLGLPVPTRERTAKVYIRAKDIQPEVIEGYADKLAAVVVTAAMTQGVTTIELHFPNRQAIRIDADTIKRACAADIGYWPDTSMVPAQASVLELWRHGAHFEPYRPQVAVPAQIGVSGDELAPKEG